MSYFLIEHEKYGKVFFNTDTQEYSYIDEKFTKLFTYKNKTGRFFNNANDFLESSTTIGIVPIVCVDNDRKGRRTFIEVNDKNNYCYKFFNVEMIDSKWVHNKINFIYKHRCYFIIISKNEYAMNDFILLSSLEIKKGCINYLHTP